MDGRLGEVWLQEVSISDVVTGETLAMPKKY